MAITERKQVLKAGDTIDENVSQVDEPTTPMPDGSMHGKVSNLTANGTGFYGVPVNESLPVISGTVQVGATLTASTGVWQDNNEPVDSYSYQWYADDVEIDGETEDELEIVEGDYGTVITVGVVATNGEGNSEEAVSAATTAVVAGVPTNSVAVTITGTAQDGEELTAVPGTWDGHGDEPVLSYQWLLDDVEIEDATDDTYTCVTADVGGVIKVVETATNDGGADSVTSAGTATVIAAE